MVEDVKLFNRLAEVGNADVVACSMAVPGVRPRRARRNRLSLS